VRSTVFSATDEMKSWADTKFASAESMLPGSNVQPKVSFTLLYTVIFNLQFNCIRGTKVDTHLPVLSVSRLPRTNPGFGAFLKVPGLRRLRPQEVENSSSS
jgi:hypothetical protein